MVLTLVLLVLRRHGHLAQQAVDDGLRAEVVAGGRAQVGLEKVGVVVNVEHGGGIEIPLLHLADFPHRRHVVGIAALGVQAQLARLRGTELPHEVREMDDFVVGTAAHGVLHHLHLVFVEIARHDAHGVFLVDNRRLARNDAVFKQEFRAEAVHVAHIHLSHPLVADVLLNALHHAARRTVREGQAEHLVVGHAVALVCPTDALGQNLRFSASGRRQHQVVAALGVDYAPLACVGGECRVFAHLVALFPQS